jgi:hypothetical protein
MCLIPMISKRYGHMSSGESPGLNVPTISFSRDLETVEVFWTTQPQPSIPMRQRVELPAEPSSRPSTIGAVEGIA